MNLTKKKPYKNAETLNQGWDVIFFYLGPKGSISKSPRAGKPLKEKLCSETYKGYQIFTQIKHTLQIYQNTDRIP